MQLISEENKAVYTAAMADNLKMLRARTNLTQRELAEMIGVSHQTYVNAEKRGVLSWNTYLSLLFLFEKEFADEPEMLNLLDNLHIYPEEYKMDYKASSEGWENQGGSYE